MTTALVNDASIQRIAVFRALHLGDLLCATPALRSLRAARPKAHIVLIGLPSARDFVERQPDLIDELLLFPGYPGFVEADHGWDAFHAFVDQAKAMRFDLAIQLHGTGYEVNDIVASLGARFVAGFYPHDQAAPSLYHLPWPESGHEIDRLSSLPKWLGAPEGDRTPSLMLTQRDRSEALGLMQSLGVIQAQYVIVHPGARLESRRWPIDRFARVACALALDGWQVVVTGSAAEASLVHAVVRAVEAAVPGAGFNVCARTSLGGLAALIEGARLMIANDTGVSHVAASVGTPSVIVSSGGDAARWAPLDHVRHRVLWHDLSCRPCVHAQCPTQHECARAIQCEAVLREARMRLAELRPFIEIAHAA